MNRWRAILLAFIDSLIVLLVVCIVFNLFKLLGELTGWWSVD